MGVAIVWAPEWEVSAEKLADVVRKMGSAKKAPGPDGIPGRVWVVVMGVLGARLQRLFNAYLREGEFPSPWKRARLVLLQKAGKPVDSPSAYRPLCLLDKVGKIFERILFARLVRHLSAVGPDLNENQFGFRAVRSTLDAIELVRSRSEGMES